MTVESILNWLPLAAHVAILIANRLRARALGRRGVRVLVVDWQRPAGQVVYDTLVVVVFFLWCWLLLAAAWPLSLAWLPEWLTAKLIDSWPARVAGAALIVIAPFLFWSALGAMDVSWRMGIDRQQPGPLVTAGVFAFSRNPIYTAFDLVFLGTVLIHGRVIFLLLAITLIALLHGVILREERFLAARYGDAFREYCQRVGRYAPWL
jgi:protein-S-isoprenylcysteine O-methyltransferase Ste14